ncbi:hypothetical protein ACIQPR_09030 [Streptomyces sp. NPDC091280]
MLDRMPGEQRAFVMGHSTWSREGLGPARADGTAVTAALRQLMGL